MKHVLLTLCLASCLCACKQPEEKVIGIQLYSVINSMQEAPIPSIERLSDMGYNAFELVQWGGDSKVFGLDASDFKKECERIGAEIISTHSGIQEDATREEEIMNEWRKLFEVQKGCGGKYFVIPSYRAEYTKEGLDAMCSYFNRVGKIAAEYGLKLGYHNHAGEFQKLKDYDAIMWEYLVENTEPEYVCFELDVYWANVGGQDPVALLKKYPNRIEVLHIKDNFVVGESGKIDFENIFKQFYANGWSDYFVEIEVAQELRDKTNPDGSALSPEQIKEEMFVAAQKSADYLRNAAFVK